MRYGIHIQKIQTRTFIIWYYIIWHCMTYYNVIRFGLEMPVPRGHDLSLHELCETYYLYIPYTYIYIYDIYIYLWITSFCGRAPYLEKKLAGFPYRKSPRKLPGDEERGLPDWYTKHLEEDLHALGLPNRPGNPWGKMSNRLRGCEARNGPRVPGWNFQGWLHTVYFCWEASEHPWEDFWLQYTCNSFVAIVELYGNIDL